MVATAVALLLLAYVAKAAIDVLTHQAGNNVFEQWGPWFDARTSWKNKYAPGSWEAGAPRPRFPGSTGPLVLLTDFWHAADAVYLSCYLAGAMLLGAALPPVWWWWLLAFAGVKAAGGAVFQLFYTRVFRIKK